MKIFKGTNSRKIGVLLAVLFIVGLSVMTIYSRSYAERQKPLVHLAFIQSGAMDWSYEVRSTIEAAGEVHADEGIEWTIDVHIPQSAFIDYMEHPYGLSAHAILDNAVFANALEIISLINTQRLDNGDIIQTYSYVPTPEVLELREAMGRPIRSGEGATVRLEQSGLEFNTLLPLSAVHRNPFTNEMYVFSVSRRSSAWGREYFVTRHDVELWHAPERIGDMANIIALFARDLPYVYHSSAPLYDGALVRIFD